jgi:hypothetical protein
VEDAKETLNLGERTVPVKAVFFNTEDTEGTEKD